MNPFAQMASTLAAPSRARSPQPGDRVHKLTLLERVRRPDRQRHYWRCLCDCGTETVVREYAVVHGTTHTCGCARLNRDKRARARDPITKRFTGGFV